MAQVRIDFQGRGKVETFPRACVQPIGDGVQLTLGVARQVCALGQVLAQQAICILVGATLPGAVRIGKEDLDRQPFRQALKKKRGQATFSAMFVAVRAGAGSIPGPRRWRSPLASLLFRRVAADSRRCGAW